MHSAQQSGYELGKEGWRWSGHYHPRGANLNHQDLKLLNDFQKGQKAGGFSVQKKTRVMDPNRIYDMNR